MDDPELCAQCGSKLEVLAAISSPAQDDVIEKILKCRGEWRPPWEHERPPRGPPKQLEVFPDEENQDPPGDAWLE